MLRLLQRFNHARHRSCGLMGPMRFRLSRQESQSPWQGDPSPHVASSVENNGPFLRTCRASAKSILELPPVFGDINRWYAKDISFSLPADETNMSGLAGDLMRTETWKCRRNLRACCAAQIQCPKSCYFRVGPDMTPCRDTKCSGSISDRII